MDTAAIAQDAIEVARSLVGQDNTAASTAFQKASALANQAGRLDIEAEAECGWAEAIFLMSGREMESIRHFERAIALAPGTVTEALARLTLGDVFRFLHDVARALPSYELSAECFARLDDVTGELLARRGLADHLQALGRDDEALPHLRRAAELSLDDDAPSDFVIVLVQLGELHARLHQETQAATVLTGAARLYRILGDRLGEARVLTRILVLEGVTESPNYEIMIRLAEIAVEQAASEGDIIAERELQHGLGHLSAEYARILEKDIG